MMGLRLVSNFHYNFYYYELLLSVMLAKRHMERGPVRVTCQSHSISGAPKKKEKNRIYSLRRHTQGAGFGSLGNALEKICNPPPFADYHGKGRNH